MFYRIVNLKTMKAMALSYNSTTIDEVREDVLLFISVDEDISAKGNTNLSDLLVEANLTIEESVTPFPDCENPKHECFNGAMVTTVKPNEKYIPKGRVSHVSTYALMG